MQPDGAKLGSKHEICETWRKNVKHVFMDQKQRENSRRRDWRLYDRESLCGRLSLLNWNFTSTSVQAYWDELENQLVSVIDDLAPVVMFSNKEVKC